MGFVIDCQDWEVVAICGAPRSFSGADIRTLMERTLWRRFGEGAIGTQGPVEYRTELQASSSSV